MQYSKALTFFAHPDDETLAAGATINKLRRQGCHVSVAIPNTGIFSRRKKFKNKNDLENGLSRLRSDCYNALSLFSIEPSDIFLGEFADNEIDRHTLLELIHWFENILDQVNPDIVITHHRFCTNIDHRYCHEAAVVATRPNTQQHIPVLCAEVSSSTGYLKPTHWEPNFFVDVTEKDVQAKIMAMQAYQGEARVDPHPRSPEVLKALAKLRGSESGFLFAEAFMIQKLFF